MTPGSELSHAQEAHRRIVADIAAGRLSPGDRLIETELAERLGISRTPIREAVRRLEAEGLVSHLPRIGGVVRTLGYAEVTELYEMRAVLEGTAARLSARAASEVELRTLADLTDEMEAALTDVSALSAANRRFHAVLLNAARNRYLVTSVQALERTLLILGPSTMEDTDRATEAVAEHRAVMAALTSRDPDAAERAMRAHIEAAHATRLKRLRIEDAA